MQDKFFLQSFINLPQIKKIWNAKVATLKQAKE
jgi:hypothetical protein